MALPAGITTATVLFGKDFDVLGGGNDVTLRITPSHTLIWEATGDRLTAFDVAVSAESDTVGTFELPHTDQTGFINEAGTEITDWWYTIVGTVRAGRAQKTYTKRVQVTSDVTSFDLDTLPVNASVGPVGSVPLPTLTSVNGQTGAVVLTASAIGAVPNTSEGRQALAESTELLDTYGAPAILNPESEQNDAIVQVVQGVFGGGTAGMLRVVDARSGITTPRPTGWSGAVVWLINDGDPNPTNATGGDFFWVVESSAVPTPTVVFTDDFNRADGAIGSTPVGALPWQTHGSGAVATVDGNRGRLSATGAAVALVDAGVADGKFTITNLNASTSLPGIVFRSTLGDTSRWLIARGAGGDSGLWRIVKRVGSTTSIEVFLSTSPIASGDVFEITLVGSAIEIKLNGATWWSGTDADNAGNTMFGFYVGGSGYTRYDDASFVTVV